MQAPLRKTAVMMAIHRLPQPVEEHRRGRRDAEDDGQISQERVRVLHRHRNIAAEARASRDFSASARTSRATYITSPVQLSSYPTPRFPPTNERSSESTTAWSDYPSA